MRILQLNSARAFGGGERHVADLASGLRSRGHDVHAAAAPASPLHAELTRLLPPENVIASRMRNAADVPGAFAIARAARGREIDIIHAHTGRDYPLAALAASLAPRARLVLTRHVMFPLARAHALTLRNASRVIAVSEAVARALAERKVFPAEKIRVVRNGVDVERFGRAAAGGGREDCRRRLGARAPLLVGTVGGLCEVKGQDDFVRAAAEVVRKMGRDAVEFLVVGEDASRDGRFRARLEQLIAELSLQRVVRLLGRREDVAEILSCLDLYVSASRSEAFGLSMVEAMACGLPIVATATGGGREIVSEGETGALAPVGDAHALAELITLFLEDDERRARAGSLAREHARARWSLARMVDETESVYREALGV